MDKKTIFAIVLAVGVMFLGLSVLPNILFPPKTNTVQTQTSTVKKEVQAPVAALVPAMEEPGQEIGAKTIDVETDLYKIRFSNEGAVVQSIELKKHQDKNGPVQMVYLKKGAGAAFETRFGAMEDAAINTPFQYVQVNNLTHQFSKKFTDLKGNTVIFTKTFTLKQNEYMIQLDIGIQTTNGALPVLSNQPYSYTVTYGPQMGPEFNALDGSQEFRKYYRFNGQNRSEEGLNNEAKSTDEAIKWAAIVGKYFTVIGIPDSTIYHTTFSNRANPGDGAVSRLSFSRPTLKSSNTQDTFRFYVGPKEESVLKAFNDPSTNSFGFSNMKLEQAMEDNFLLGWLEFLLKMVLIGCHTIIPNWGVGIILLTLLVKILTWPLTAKSFKSSAAMQAVQPKLKELQEKYKDDPKKLNEQMMALYQKEGVNPLGGCLPMLLQIPIFFALYGLFNNQFDLRGAMFIPGWIPDLSVPDVVVSWGFQLPLLGWSALHLLPIVMVGTQIWTSLLTQPASGMNGQMKIMTFGIPVIFFFMLYQMPAGLMVYWCVQNILTVVQQSLINKNFKKNPVKTTGKIVNKTRRIK